jgi:hypothetical protein
MNGFAVNGLLDSELLDFFVPASILVSLYCK